MAAPVPPRYTFNVDDALQTPPSTTAAPDHAEESWPVPPCAAPSVPAILVSDVVAASDNTLTYAEVRRNGHVLLFTERHFFGGQLFERVVLRDDQCPTPRWVNLHQMGQSENPRLKIHEGVRDEVKGAALVFGVEREGQEKDMDISCL